MIHRVHGRMAMVVNIIEAQVVVRTAAAALIVRIASASGTLPGEAAAALFVRVGVLGRRPRSSRAGASTATPAMTAAAFARSRRRGSRRDRWRRNG